jgi:hypothetical protein
MYLGLIENVGKHLSKKSPSLRISAAHKTLDTSVDYKNQVLITHATPNRLRPLIKSSNIIRRKCRTVFSRLENILDLLG